MLCLSGFELYCRWVPLSFFPSKFMLVTKKRICRKEIFDLFFFLGVQQRDFDGVNVTKCKKKKQKQKKTPLTVEHGRFKRLWLSKC